MVTDMPTRPAFIIAVLRREYLVNHSGWLKVGILSFMPFIPKTGGTPFAPGARNRQEPLSLPGQEIGGKFT